jgi:hypothetical protein
MILVSKIFFEKFQFFDRISDTSMYPRPKKSSNRGNSAPFFCIENGKNAVFGPGER